MSANPPMKEHMLRRARRAGRTTLLRLLVRATRPESDNETDPLRGRPLRVLFITAEGFDDTLLALRAARAAAESYPGTLVDLVLRGGHADAASALPYVNDVIFVAPGRAGYLAAARAIRRRRAYDVVIDGGIGDTRVDASTITLMLACRAPFWIGESGRANDDVFNVRLEPADPCLLRLERLLRLVGPLVPAVAAEDSTAPLAIPTPRLMRHTTGRHAAAAS